MSGGLLQLAAIGAQDAYLTIDHEVSFFRMSYNRHTNFSVETIPAVFTGSTTFGQKVTCTIPRNGDLVTSMFLKVNLQDLNPGITDLSQMNYFWTNSIGHAMIQEVELEIGGTTIDKHYGIWLEIWSELTQKEEKLVGYERMIGKLHDNSTDIMGDDSHAHGMNLMIPLTFYFCRDIRLAIPLISLQYHDVRVSFKFANLEDCIHKRDGFNTIPHSCNMFSANLMVDYVFMDTEERRSMAQDTHEYLIEQLQYTVENIPMGNTTSNINLCFNHPVKELIWAIEENTTKTLPFTFKKLQMSGDNCETTEDETFIRAKLQINGHDRMCYQDAEYYRLMMPFQRHSRIPGTPIYCYSFALKPEDPNPTGTINMSRIDMARMNLEMKPSLIDRQFHTFARNYNVLKVQSGMAGLAFSN